LFSSSSGSCHGSDATWQEIGRVCGSVCSCRVNKRPSFLLDAFRFLPFGISVRQEVSVYKVCQKKILPLTYHTNHDNHDINRLASAILDMELGRSTNYQVDQESGTNPEKIRHSMNRNDCSYTLSHTHERFLATLYHYRDKNRKKN